MPTLELPTFRGSGYLIDNFVAETADEEIEGAMEEDEEELVDEGIFDDETMEVERLDAAGTRDTDVEDNTVEIVLEATCDSDEVEDGVTNLDAGVVELEINDAEVVELETKDAEVVELETNDVEVVELETKDESLRLNTFKRELPPQYCRMSPVQSFEHSLAGAATDPLLSCLPQ